MISKGFYFSSKIEKNKGDRDFECGIPVSMGYPSPHGQNEFANNSNRFSQSFYLEHDFFGFCKRD